MNPGAMSIPSAQTAVLKHHSPPKNTTQETNKQQGLWKMAESRAGGMVFKVSLKEDKNDSRGLNSQHAEPVN